MEEVAPKGKTPAIFAYMTFIGTIIAFFMNNDDKHPFASFHIRQALGIHITFYFLGLLVSSFDSWYISAPFYLFIISLWGYGLGTAIMGQQNEVPLLGKTYQKIFSPIN